MLKIMKTKMKIKIKELYTKLVSDPKYIAVIATSLIAIATKFIVKIIFNLFTTFPSILIWPLFAITLGYIVRAIVENIYMKKKWYNNCFRYFVLKNYLITVFLGLVTVSITYGLYHFVSRCFK